MIQRDGSMGFRVLAIVGVLTLLLSFGAVLHSCTHTFAHGFVASQGGQ